MRFSTIVAASVCIIAANAHIANPLVKRFTSMPVGIAGRELINNGLFKRATCPSGQTSCGSGCASGPCCDASGLSCRAGEYCTTVSGQTACCANGFSCDAVRACENADSPGCVAGSVNDGRLCCDSSAPFCNTEAATPFCQAYLTGVAYVSPASSTVTVTGVSTLTAAGSATTAAGSISTTTAPGADNTAPTTTSVATVTAVASTATVTDGAPATSYPTVYASTISSISNYVGTTTLALPVATSTYSGPDSATSTKTEYSSYLVVGGPSSGPSTTAGVSATSTATEAAAAGSSSVLGGGGGASSATASTTPTYTPPPVVVGGSGTNSTTTSGSGSGSGSGTGTSSTAITTGIPTPSQATSGSDRVLQTFTWMAGVLILAMVFA